MESAFVDAASAFHALHVKYRVGIKIRSVVPFMAREILTTWFSLYFLMYFGGLKEGVDFRCFIEIILSGEEWYETHYCNAGGIKSSSINLIGRSDTGKGSIKAVCRIAAG